MVWLLGWLDGCLVAWLVAWLVGWFIFVLDVCFDFLGFVFFVKKKIIFELMLSSRYNEVCDPGYNFNGGGTSGGTGHFTQVVWKGSTKLGIGRAETTKNGMKCAYIVGRYDPAGNMIGSYPANVQKGKFDASYCKTVTSKKRKYYDKNGNAVIMSTPLAEVDVPDVKIGAFLRSPTQASIEFLNNNKKKTFVGHKHH